MSIVLSHFQVAPILHARTEGKTVASTSADLGITPTRVILDAEGILFPAGERLAWDAVQKIAESKNSCFVWQAGALKKIQTFSGLTNRAYSLYPTASAPTMLVAGFPMHRIKDTDPYQDTLAMVKTIAPIVGRVLDTAAGLGYTAIEAARAAEHVVTIELDPAATEIARLNPWSSELFSNSKIERLIGDSFEIVPTFQPGTFNHILHDPPTFRLAEDLYSTEFYRALYRVLRRGGKLFHYIGDLESKFGANVARGVMGRLREAGFGRIVKKPEAFGVVGYK